MHVGRWFGTAVVAAALASCGGPGGTLEDCIGSYAGTYAGDDSGSISATLDRDQELEVSFVSSEGDGDETTADYTVTSSNALSRDRGRLDLSGTFDVETCAIEGDWTLANASGTYTLKKFE